MVAEQLERNDVQQALKAVNSPRQADGLRALRDAFVSLITDDDGLGFASRDLRKRGLHLGIEGILGHDDDDGHILVHQCKWSVLELTRKNTLRNTRQKRELR